MTVIATLPIIWLAVILASIFCEAIFENLVCVWFAPAAFISLICGAFDMTARGQVIVFFVSGVVMISVARIFFLRCKRRRKHISERSDIE